MAKMTGCVHVDIGKVELQDLERPLPGPGQALLKVTLTTICGTDLHVLETPISGVVMGHEMTGVVEEVGEGVTGFEKGDRVLTSCLTPCGQCPQCLSGNPEICTTEGGAYRFGMLIHGCQAEYLLVPYAQANLFKIPRELEDRQVLFATDIMSTAIGVLERAPLRVGDRVAIFAQGPLGLCVTAAAKALGAGMIIAVESVPERCAMSRRLGADMVLNPEECDPVAEILSMTGDGVDVAVEAVGKEAALAGCFQVTRPGGTISGLGAYGALPSNLSIPVDPTRFYHRRYVTTLCPCGPARLARMIEIICCGRIDLTPLWTHTMRLADICQAYELFRERREGVIKIAIEP